MPIRTFFTGYIYTQEPEKVNDWKVYLQLLEGRLIQYYPTLLKLSKKCIISTMYGFTPHDSILTKIFKKIRNSQNNEIFQQYGVPPH